MKKFLFPSAIVLVCLAAYFIQFERNKATQNAQESSADAQIGQPVPQKVDPNGGMVSLNFDDGWESAYQKAVPILDQAGMKATFYIITQKHDDMHMTDEQILDIYAKGNEIGAHTRTHPDLTRKSPVEQIEEIFGSRIDLLRLGIKSVDTFAYPYGNLKSGLEKIVQDAGFTGARTTDSGANDSSTDRYALKSVDIKKDTDFSAIQAAIDKAVKNKQWLIITFHRIDETGDAIDNENVSHEILQQTVDYLKSNHIAEVTNSEGLRLLDRNN